MKRPLKILMFVSSLRKSGPIVVVQNLLKNLDKETHHVEIVKLMPDEPQRSITSEFQEAGYPIHELESSKLEVELFPYKVAKRFQKIVEEVQPDVIHVHGYQCNRIVTRADVAIPIVETVHCILKEDYKVYNPIQRLYMTYNHLHGLKKVSAIVAISNTVKSYCITNTQNSNIETIYNGVASCSNLSRIEARHKLGFSENDTIFCVVASFIERKDPKTVVQAFLKAFPKDRANVKLIFLGKGVLEEECRNLAKQDNRIIFEGWKPNAFEYLTAADYSICATHSEGFGLNFIESLVNKTPVIGTQISAFKEFYQRYPVLNQLSFEPGDVDSLALRLQTAYGMHIDMSAISLDASDNFGAKAMADKYIQMYDRVVKSKLS